VTINLLFTLTTKKKQSTINMTSNNNNNSHEQQHDELLQKMEGTRKKWMEEDDDDGDDTDRFLQEAIDMAVKQGKGWSPGEKEEYMKRILDDDFIPPMFCSTEEELVKTGLADAFAALQYEDDPSITMLEYKQKGTNAFLDGKRNQARNVQYYRDAINHYYEAIAWANKIEPQEQRQQKQKTKQKQQNCGVEFQEYTEQQLDEIKSTLYSNAALCHLQLKNWGHVRDDSTNAVTFNDQNIKAWYRLAKSYQMLQQYEDAGTAIESGLQVDSTNAELLKLQSTLGDKIRKARIARQKRERIRAERVSQIKQVWKHCNNNQHLGGKIIRLGRVALVASVSDDDDYDDGQDSADVRESRWHHHFPHTGVLPTPPTSTTTMTAGVWSWPCLFLYPSHSQSDFVKHFNEDEMLAIRMADMFPEIDGDQKTTILWDYNNEFQCSKLAVYFEVNCPNDIDTNNNNNNSKHTVVHPDNVERLTDLASTMKFFESSRALKGDEGPEMANLAKAVERKRLHRQRQAWKKLHGSLWAKPDPCPVVRIHPAMTLKDILTDPRMVVANFMVTLVMIPEDHPAHADYLKEHKCLGILQPDDN
jgi:tetratricopeptide (TPR) repeat protein